MTKFTKELIENYGDKLLIGLTETETNNLLDEFEVIEENMNLIYHIHFLIIYQKVILL